MTVIVRIADLSDADSIARVHVASWEDAYRGIVPDAVIDARTVDVRRAQWIENLSKGDSITLVACDERGTIQGFASARLLNDTDDKFQSYLHTLYVRPETQNRGVGRQLLQAIATRLRDCGARNLALRTLRLGHVRVFYEHLGARLVPEDIDNDGGTFDDVIYVFDDISALVD
ncbi:MAG: GNAT family N-acetyltransferase [Candidatus Eremiobacteraeota bacterium]|nr:GNAT family N-acetyltransferase [Candidatus Eremiobacteraeota bacterium]